MLTTAAVFGGGALGIVQWMGRDAAMERPVVFLSQKTPAELRERLRQLGSELAIRTRVVAALVRKEQDALQLEPSAGQAGTGIDSSIRIQTELEKAALIILHQADRRYDELDLKASAIEEYRQVIEYFPSTLGARKARQRLARIEKGLEGVYDEKADRRNGFVRHGSTDNRIGKWDPAADRGQT